MKKSKSKGLLGYYGDQSEEERIKLLESKPFQKMLTAIYDIDYKPRSSKFSLPKFNIKDCVLNLNIMDKYFYEMLNFVREEVQAFTDTERANYIKDIIKDYALIGIITHIEWNDNQWVYSLAYPENKDKNGEFNTMGVSEMPENQLVRMANKFSDQLNAEIDQRIPDNLQRDMELTTDFFVYKKQTRDPFYNAIPAVYKCIGFDEKSLFLDRVTFSDSRKYRSISRQVLPSAETIHFPLNTYELQNIGVNMAYVLLRCQDKNQKLNNQLKALTK